MAIINTGDDQVPAIIGEPVLVDDLVERTDINITDRFKIAVMRVFAKEGLLPVNPEEGSTPSFVSPITDKFKAAVKKALKVLGADLSDNNGVSDSVVVTPKFVSTIRAILFELKIGG